MAKDSAKRDMEDIHPMEKEENSVGNMAENQKAKESKAIAGIVGNKDILRKIAQKESQKEREELKAIAGIAGNKGIRHRIAQEEEKV